MMSSHETLGATETSAAAPTVDLLDSMTATDLCHLHHHQQRHHIPHHLGHQLHCQCKQSSSGDMGGEHTLTASDSDTEGCHGHYCCNDTATGHATGDNNYLPR